MNYSDYDELDFAFDDAFIQWVRFPAEESEKYWQNIIKEYPDKGSIIYSARKMLLSISFREYEWVGGDKEKLKERLLTLIKAQRAHKAPVRSIIWKRAISYLGTAAVLSGVALLLYSIFLKPNDHELISYSTSAGEIKKVNLPDSSVITLNENSTLDFRMDSLQHQRIATLTGEGYFKVKGNAASPFSVVVNNLKVQVLGTEFNIRSDGALTSVALQSGKLRLVIPEEGRNSISENYLEMQPGQVIEYSEIQKQIVKNEWANINAYAKWKNRILIFEKTTLREVADRVYENYGVTLKLPEDILDQTFSARIVIEDGNLDILLKLLSESFQLDIKRDEDTIYAKERVAK